MGNHEGDQGGKILDFNAAKGDKDAIDLSAAARQLENVDTEAEIKWTHFVTDSAMEFVGKGRTVFSDEDLRTVALYALNMETLRNMGVTDNFDKMRERIESWLTQSHGGDN